MCNKELSSKLIGTIINVVIGNACPNDPSKVVQAKVLTFHESTTEDSNHLIAASASGLLVNIRMVSRYADLYSCEKCIPWFTEFYGDMAGYLCDIHSHALEVDVELIATADYSELLMYGKDIKSTKQLDVVASNLTMLNDLADKAIAKSKVKSGDIVTVLVGTPSIEAPAKLVDAEVLTVHSPRLVSAGSADGLLRFVTKPTDLLNGCCIDAVHYCDQVIPWVRGMATGDYSAFKVHADNITTMAELDTLITTLDNK